MKTYLVNGFKDYATLWRSELTWIRKYWILHIAFCVVCIIPTLICFIKDWKLEREYRKSIR